MRDRLGDGVTLKGESMSVEVNYENMKALEEAYERKREERDRLREAMEAMLKNVKTVKHYATYTVCRDSWIALMQEALKNEA